MVDAGADVVGNREKVGVLLRAASDDNGDRTAGAADVHVKGNPAIEGD